MNVYMYMYIYVCVYDMHVYVCVHNTTTFVILSEFISRLCCLLTVASWAIFITSLYLMSNGEWRN